MRGRKPQLTIVKKLKKTRKSRINENEPKLEAGSPEPPDWLSEGARNHWDYLVPSLVESGIIAHTDLAILSLYCMVWDEYIKLVEFKKKMPNPIIKMPNGTITPCPVDGRINAKAKILASLASELGLTPVSRSRVTALKSEKSENKWAKFAKNV